LNNHQPVPIEAIEGTAYAKVLNYPASDGREVGLRVRELTAIGITGIRFVGPSMIDGIKILGKGCVGLVTQALFEGKPVALKIRRFDADRPSMHEEARLLRFANSVNVGPRLIAATKNFLVMELFTGLPLFRWASGNRRPNAAVRLVLWRLLSSCVKLDAIGLDHGELSHAPKNVLIGPNARTCIVDFESASMVRRGSNITSLLQYFLYGSISRTLDTSRIFPQKRPILRALSRYKREASVESYLRLLETLQLKHYYHRSSVSDQGGAVV